MNKPTNRRVFMMQTISVAGVGAFATTAAQAAMVDEKDPQAAGLGYKADATKVEKPSNPNTLQVKCVAIAPCIKAKRQTLLAVARCLLASKWLVKAGARLGLRRLNFSLGLFAGPHKWEPSGSHFLCLCAFHVPVNWGVRRSAKALRPSVKSRL